MSILSRLRLAEKQPTPDLTERGSDSVTYVSGGSRTLADQETSWKLRGLQGSKTYRQMRIEDPHIRGLRRAQNVPLLKADAAIDPLDPKDADAVAKADFVRQALIDDFPFRSFLSDTMLAIDYGFSAFEIVWYRDSESGHVRCRLELRPASSIAPEDVHVKDGAIDYIVQKPLEGGEKTIDGAKLVWFCHDKEGGAWQGTSILRSMYRNWKIKRELEQELPSAVRRLAGIPDISYAGTLPDEVKTTLEQMGERIGLSADGYSLHPDAVTVQLLTGNASIDDILAAIHAQDQALSAACQAQVFDLGTGATGSWALGKTLSDLFANSVQAEAKYREDVINATGGLIHQLVTYNFPTDDNRPKLRFGHVQAVDMKSFAGGLLAMSQAFQNLPEDLQDWARAEMNAPEGPPVTQVVVPKAPEDEPSAPASSKSQGPGADAADGSAIEDGARASECGCGHGHLTLAERRQPVGAECYVALAELEGRFTDARTAVREATQVTRDKLAAELARRAASASDLAKFAAGAPPMVDKLTTEIRAVLTDFYEAGRAQVRDELQRQRAGDPVTPIPLEDRRVIEAAEKSPRKAKPADLPDADEAIDAEAAAMARAIAAQTQAAAASAAARVGSGVPLTPADLVTAVTRESDSAALRLGVAVSDLMQLGRATEANEQASDIAYGMVSAILDVNTCAVCEEADGFESENLDEVAALAPNPGCEGGDRCRCFGAFILKGTEEAA